MKGYQEKYWEKRRNAFDINYTEISSLNSTIQTKQGDIEVIELLKDFSESFPNGFKSYEANKYLQNKYNAWTENGKFFTKLLDLGFLESNKKSTGNLPSKRQNFYKVNKKAMKGYSAAKEENIEQENLEKSSFYNLLQTYLSQGKENLNKLEKTLFEDNSFVEKMDFLKSVSEESYVKSGGEYLDKIKGKYESGNK